MCLSIDKACDNQSQHQQVDVRGCLGINDYSKSALEYLQRYFAKMAMWAPLSHWAVVQLESKPWTHMDF